MVISYKVIEERLTPSGRIEYLTLPLYVWLTVDEVERHSKMIAKPQYLSNVVHGIYSFVNLEDVKDWMAEHSLGYYATRPAIYRCESEESKCHIEDGKVISEEIRFCEPLFHMVNGKISDYVRMTVPEKKKSSFGIVYDESEITGDVETQEDK